MTHFTSLVVVLKTVTLLLGAAITYFALKAYLRTGSRALRSLTVGFGVVTLGSLLAGAVDRGFAPVVVVDGTSALAVESALTAIGFGIILYSLYVE